MNNYYNKFITNPINQYDYYKKSPQEMQNIISSMNFTSAQNSVSDFAFQKNQSAKLNTPSFLKGLALGLGLGLLATNPTVQKAIIDSSLKVWGGIQNNIEEIKEQIQDAKAEISAEEFDNE